MPEIFETWLIVFEGHNLEKVKEAVREMERHSVHSQVHHVLFSESAGERQAILLVHWTALERDNFLERCSLEWNYHFVNRVQDLSESDSDQV